MQSQDPNGARAPACPPGPRLVIGGGRAPDYPRLRRRDLSVDISADAQPHIRADVRRLPLPSAVFPRVFFEFIPYTAITSREMAGLDEAVRVLAPGGHLRILTGQRAPAAQITAHLRTLGLHGVRAVDHHGALLIDGRKPRPRPLPWAALFDA